MHIVVDHGPMYIYKKDDLKLIINEVELLFKPRFPLALLLTEYTLNYYRL